jgi:hypothetical protein
MRKSQVDKAIVRWTEVDGSIFTEDPFPVALPFKVGHFRLAIAFNVGRDLARHIADTHNAALVASPESPDKPE